MNQAENFHFTYAGLTSCAYCLLDCFMIYELQTLCSMAETELGESLEMAVKDDWEEMAGREFIYAAAAVRLV